MVAEEPSTAVTGPGPLHTGLRRYDVILKVRPWEVRVKLQASDYPKPAQQLAQLTGFGEGRGQPSDRAQYYKIIGASWEIHRWTREQASKLVRAPPTVLK